MTKGFDVFCSICEFVCARVLLQFQTCTCITCAAEDPQVTLELLNDPEIAKAATDPEGMAVIQDATRQRQWKGARIRDV